MSERLPFHFSLSCIGEGNGNPLQCSCLENPRDGGAWWASVYGVAQSRTRLKRLSPVRFFETPWTVAYQAPPSMDFPGMSIGVGCQVLRQHVGAAVALRQALLSDQVQ